MSNQSTVSGYFSASALASAGDISARTKHSGRLPASVIPLSHGYIELHHIFNQGHWKTTQNICSTWHGKVEKPCRNVPVPPPLPLCPALIRHPEVTAPWPPGSGAEDEVRGHQVRRPLQGWGRGSPSVTLGEALGGSALAYLGKR
ncbi:hypothetical protein H920_11528 [Fukomys damarensis]|uniref:Uncharacterized protein n=1 Tax=Fukomys damarensis TaxID=885580 RepID=A0A091D9F7_FUKDA|nr:hypothetical protein H920_11528 [Fukomys damarensis]